MYAALFFLLSLAMFFTPTYSQGVKDVLNAKDGVYCKSTTIDDREYTRCWRITEVDSGDPK